MKPHKFKAGDKVICKESHTGSQYPIWPDCMDAFVGAHGTVLDYISVLGGEYVRVTFSPRLSKTDWCFLEDWLVPALEHCTGTTQDNPQDKMTEPLTPQEEFITVRAMKVYAHMSDRVAYYRVHLDKNAYFNNDTPIEYVLKAPKKEETPQPVPKFQKGDIVVCKTKPRAASPSWGRDVLLGVPGRVVGPCPNGVTVEFLGDRVVYDFRDEWLVHEEPDIAKTMQDLFARKN